MDIITGMGFAFIIVYAIGQVVTQISKDFDGVPDTAYAGKDKPISLESD
jgi:hypothetical protein